jgi:hypothetical protein
MEGLIERLRLLRISAQSPLKMIDHTIEMKPPAPGALLGSRCRLDDELARGGMGVVYRAADLDLPTA